MTAKFTANSEFSKSADALGLTDAERENALALMGRSETGLNDPQALNWVGIAKMQGIMGDMQTLAKGIHTDFIANGRNLIGGVERAIGKEMKTQLETLPATLSDKVDARITDYVRDLANNVDAAITKEAESRQNFRLAGLVFVGFVAVSVALGLGYYVGRDTVTSDSVKWETLSKMDAGGWLALARMNDLGKVFAQNCGPSSGRLISGGKVCDLSLFVSPPVATSQGTELVWLSVAEYANRLGWGGYILTAGFGLLGGWAFGRRKKAH